jgi:hypothetical protein
VRKVRCACPALCLSWLLASAHATFAADHINFPLMFLLSGDLAMASQRIVEDQLASCASQNQAWRLRFEAGEAPRSAPAASVTSAPPFPPFSPASSATPTPPPSLIDKSGKVCCAPHQTLLSFECQISRLLPQVLHRPSSLRAFKPSATPGLVPRTTGPPRSPSQAVHRRLRTEDPCGITISL